MTPQLNAAARLIARLPRYSCISVMFNFLM